MRFASRELTTLSTYWTVEFGLSDEVDFKAIRCGHAEASASSEIAMAANRTASPTRAEDSASVPWRHHDGSPLDEGPLLSIQRIVGVTVMPWTTIEASTISTTVAQIVSNPSNSACPVA